MSDILEVMKNLNLDPNKVSDVMAKVSSNPFSAVAALGELGLTMDKLKALYEVIQRDPEALTTFAASIGADPAAIDAARKKAESLFR